MKIVYSLKTEISIGDPDLLAHKIRFEKVWDEVFFADPRVPEKKARATPTDNARMVPYLEVYRSKVLEVGFLQDPHPGCPTV